MILNVELSRYGKIEVDEVKIVRIESQTAQYKVYNFLLKAKYKPLIWLSKLT